MAKTKSNASSSPEAAATPLEIQELLESNALPTTLEKYAAIAAHFGIPLWVMFIPGLPHERLVDGAFLQELRTHVQAYLAVADDSQTLPSAPSKRSAAAKETTDQLNKQLQRLFQAQSLANDLLEDICNKLNQLGAEVA